MLASSAPKPQPWRKHVHHFDIDNYLDRVIPRPRFYLLPSCVSHWFGYRSPSAELRSAPANPVIWLSACLGGFIGIAIISAVYHALPMLGGQQVPVVIASFGAAAILEFNTIESPLSQPRNLIVGHLLSALIGVSITKGFERLPEERFEDLRWLAGSISVGLASLVMGVTKTVHPPAGATALLAATSRDITVLGWWLLPLVLLASTLMSASALIVNNITRRWPIYWWTSTDLSTKGSDVKHVHDIEKDTTNNATPSVASDSTMHVEAGHSKHGEDSRSLASSASTMNVDEFDIAPDVQNTEYRIVITREAIILPYGMEANDWEIDVLETFKQKLQQQQ